MRQLFTSSRQVAETPANETTTSPSSTRPTIDDAEPSTSSTSSTSSARPPHPQLRPTSRRHDPEHPLAPRTRRPYDDLPRIQFYAVADGDAEAEFEVVAPQIVSLLSNWGYGSYSVSLAHAGYSSFDTVPVVLIVARELKFQQGNELVQVFDELPRQHLREVFCYEGDTRGYVIGEDMQTPQDNVDCGFSIGPASDVRGADPASSCSLGFYVRIDGDPAVYATCVHHALGSEVGPVALGSLPEIPMQHPSSRDLQKLVKDFENELKDAIAIDSAAVKKNLLVSSKQLKKDISKYKNLDTAYGDVVASAFGIMEADGLKVSEDRLLMRVNPARVGKNHIYASMAVKAAGSRGLAWTPHDYTGVFVNGVDNLAKGLWVRKSGRSTGDTIGRVQFAYSHAKLDGNPCETREWTVISSPFSDYGVFSSEGDSGAAVVNRKGDLVGVVLGGTGGKPIELEGHEDLGKVFVSYLTPAPLIVKQIASIVGRKVTVELVDLDGVPGIVKDITEESLRDGEDSD